MNVAQLGEAMAIAPVVCAQNRYSLGQPEHEPVLRACAEDRWRLADGAGGGPPNAAGCSPIRFHPAGTSAGPCSAATASS